MLPRSSPIPPSEPHYEGIDGTRPVIASTAPGPVDRLLRSQDWSVKLGELAEAVVEAQLRTFTESRKDAELRAEKDDSLVNLSAIKVIESLSSNRVETIDALTAIESIPHAVARHTLWSTTRLSYIGFLSTRNAMEYSHDNTQSLGDTDDMLKSMDIDEWILRNERGLRDQQGPDWHAGLIAYSKHAETTFPNSTLTPSSRTLSRSPVSGYTFLDDLRPDTLRLQPSIDAFRRAFSLLTEDILRGLDWANVFIAGGAALSSLCCVDPGDLDKYKTSDIDIYLYGLDPPAANKKIEAIFEVWKNNLPEEAKDDVLVVKNSRTVTFFATYPIKRVQIVLKLVSSPKEVLLNFDLDQCAVGWDGNELWLLPRAARALETGYTVFTMNMIEGHYLGERRATQEQRLFKYADKGYGVRILSSYIQKLHEIMPSSTQNEATGHSLSSASADSGLLESIAAKASAWTKKVIKKYPPWGREDDLYRFTHAMIEERTTKVSEPADRSCLVSFETLFRHVALWQEKVKGNITIDDTSWATTEYDLPPGVPLGYDDLPAYEWNNDFTVSRLEEHLRGFNTSEARTFFGNNNMGPNAANYDNLQADTQTQRLLFGHGISSVLSNNVVICLFVPPSFVIYANALVKAALFHHGLELETVLEEMISASSNPVGYSEFLQHAGGVIPARWKIGPMLTWQLLDRRIDEVFEILWSFHRSHNSLILGESFCLDRLKTELSRRSIRRTPPDEFSAFARWVLRKPIRTDSSYAVEQGFWRMIYRSDDEESDSDEEKEVDENLDYVIPIESRTFG